MNYPFTDIEKKWQQYWDEHETFKTVENSSSEGTDSRKQKLYVLDMFPYPSGAGLHVGHPEGYTATDIYCRFKRMRGFNVLHPMGWDAFGLPAERYAMTTGIHPSITTAENVATFKRQIKMLGLSYDWSREINTTDPAYYKWTQWIFLKIYNSWFDPAQQKARPISELKIPEGLSGKERYEFIQSHRLAYLAEMPVNWCAELGTVLANEEVGEWVEKGYTVERRSMKQWMLRITAYAERLSQDLEGLDWPPGIIEMQRNWIGRSEGAEADFRIKNSDRSIRIFTTRPDTIFGATYMVLAPEHPLVDIVTTPDLRKAVDDYRNQTKLKSELERTALDKEKTGVFTGGYAINPATKKEIPIWIADYVILTYGTGAIMAVPAGDERDFEFALKYHLPIPSVVLPPKEWLTAHCRVRLTERSESLSQLLLNARHLPPTIKHEAQRIFTEGTLNTERIDAIIETLYRYEDVGSYFMEAFVGDGVAINSSNDEFSIDDLPTDLAKTKIVLYLIQKKVGVQAINYKLRDWLFSRQRYWGEPFPIIYREDGTVKALPESTLPILLPSSETFKPSPSGESPLANIASWVNTNDAETGKPARRETHTMPQWAGSCWYYLRYLDPKNDNAFISKDKEKYWMPIDLYVGGAEHAVLHLLYSRFWHKVLYDLQYLSTKEPFQKLINQGTILGEDGQKMSKSRGNVVNPDDVVREYGADSLRLFEMFMGPLVDSKPWSMHGVEGVHRFLNRVWRMMTNEDGSLHAAIAAAPLTEEQERLLHQTIKKVTSDIETLNFNTAISQLMIFVNEFLNADPKPRTAMETFVLLLAPFAPHLAEELWQKFGHAASLAYESWPSYDEAKTRVDTIEMVVQVNGKVRTKFPASVDIDDDALKKMVLEDENVKRHLDGKQIVKVVVVKNKLVSLVVK
ncbi:MAG: leucine--tRNA ligase [Ignavibacteriae bacterium]|nr:leucine--tRNA ligase [Ignavibacteria bacterium]MBI3364076.1 leucine--tRNA ligase [Ignavibacteriota bacterium]